MRDGRTAPFCFQTLDATAAIRGRFTGQDRTIVLAIYTSLTWAANEARSRDEFEVPRAELADLAGVSQRTFDRKVKDLEELGLLVRSGGRATGKPNAWTLVEPGQEGGVSQSHPYGLSVSPGASEEHQGVRHSDTTPLYREEENEEIKKTPSPLLVEEFEAWLVHHESVTGMAPPGVSTKARAKVFSMYRARREEGKPPRTADLLELATLGAYTDEWRHQRGYYDHESVLRGTKIHKLIEGGKRAQAAGKGTPMNGWPAWVAKELPEAEGIAATMAVQTAQMLAGGGHEVTVEKVRAKLGILEEAA